MLQHLKGYQKSIMLIKSGRLNKEKTTQILIDTDKELSLKLKCLSV